MKSRCHGNTNFAWSALLVLLVAAQFHDPGPDLQANTMRQKDDHLVLEELESQGQADFWVVFADQGDLGSAVAIEDWAECIEADEAMKIAPPEEGEAEETIE